MTIIRPRQVGVRSTARFAGRAFCHRCPRLIHMRPAAGILDVCFDRCRTGPLSYREPKRFGIKVALRLGRMKPAASQMGRRAFISLTLRNEQRRVLWPFARSLGGGHACRPAYPPACRLGGVWGATDVFPPLWCFSDRARLLQALAGSHTELFTVGFFAIRLPLRAMATLRSV